MKFRLKHVEGLGYYLQVKHGFFSRWKKVGKHATGFGLYPADDLYYPMITYARAYATIAEYKEWYRISHNPKAEYHTVTEEEERI